MFDWFKARVLQWMKVPHEPDPPLGAPGSVRVFRAGRNFYRLKVLRWSLGQLAASVGLVVSLILLGGFGAALNESGEASSLDSTATATAPGSDALPGEPPAPVRSYLLPLIGVLEVGGLAAFLAQMLLTFAIVRLEFEQHWYIVTDRSLRIRTGILRLQESTMSFANIQQVEIRQGPLQRLLGLSDICVRSAGGGDPGPEAQGRRHEQSLHMGVFAGVENALEIRDLILHRLRKFRESGLGDPEDQRMVGPAGAEPMGTSLPEAVAELLTETKALRRTLVGEG